MPTKAEVKEQLLIKLKTVHTAITTYRFRSQTMLRKLQDLDKALTAQWFMVNSAKTAAGGLAVGSAIMMFIFPLVGIGLGIGAAGVGVSTTIGDWITDYIQEGSFDASIKQDEQHHKLFIDALKAYQVALTEARKAHGNISADDLLKKLAEDPDWLKQLAAVVKVVSSSGSIVAGAYDGAQSIFRLAQIATLSSTVVGLGEGVNGVIQVGMTGTKLVGIGGGGALAGTKIVASTAVKALGSVAAVISVADAAYSWSTSKNVQTSVRGTIEKVTTGNAGLKNDFPDWCS